MSLFFIVDYVLPFLLVATFLIINFSIFCFLYMRINEPNMFRQIFFPFILLSPVSPPHCFLIVYSFQGIKGKN